MSDKNDPFGLSNDAGRTRIRPIKRSDAPATANNQPPPDIRASSPRPQSPQQTQSYTASGRESQSYGQSPGQAAPRIRHARAHPNPLIACFSALLELAPELERSTPPAQPSALRVKLQDNLIDARDAAVGMGIPLTRADQAAWFVAALLDDIALNTPWGGGSDWPRQPLVVALSGEVDSGTRFFDRVDDLMRHANRDPQMLELAYICVGLGFRGKQRVQPGAGESALMALRTQIARMLRDPDQETAPLSPHWQGVDAPDEKRRFVIPIWTIALVAAGLILAIHVSLGLQLANKSDQLFALAKAVAPAERAEIIRPLRETAAPTPEIVIVPVVTELKPDFIAKVPPDLVAAMTIAETAQLTTLLVQGTNPELFRSAKADINAQYLPLIAAMAAVITARSDVVGKVIIIGHTDNVPVQKKNPFGSNQGLSEARAKAVADLLVASGVDASLVTSEGHADQEPIGDNKTKKGQAQNRRIEIKIEKRF